MVVDAETKALLSFQILAEMRINLAPIELRSRLNIGRYTKFRKEIKIFDKEYPTHQLYFAYISTNPGIVCKCSIVSNPPLRQTNRPHVG
jgi:hypothetical protein